MKAKLPDMTEHQHQCAFIQWFEAQYPNVLIFAIPNGGQRHIGTARKLKAEGVRAGIPDLCVPKWKLWIEMKKIKGKLSDEQIGMINYLTENVKDNVIVAYGINDAIVQVTNFARENDLS